MGEVMGLARARREARRLAVPLILANLAVPLLGMVDTAVVGHLPAPADLTAAALATQLVSVLWFLFGFLRMGTTALAAQAVGAGDKTALTATGIRALATALAIGGVLMLLSWPLQFLGHLLFLPSPEVAAGFDRFLAIRLLGAPAALGQFALTGWLLGRQDARGPLLVAVLGNVLNAVLDVWFVLGLGLGLSSVAVATTLSEYAGLLVALALVLRKIRPGRAAIAAALADRPALARLFRVNRDLFLRSCFLEGSFIAFTVLAARQGETFVAANAILMTFFTATAWLLDGFAQAGETMIGRATGARSAGSLHLAMRVAFEYGLVLAVLLTGLLAWGGPFAIELMTHHAAVQATAHQYLPFVIALPIVSVWAFVLDGVFFGTGRAEVLRNAMALALGLFLVSAALLVPVLGGTGLWLTLLLFLASRGVLLWWSFRRIGGSRALAVPHGSG
ncbi:MAG TPA: MATE family efflux transporter [Geminicoccus sp.]|uniref:MATE family efflux transporter n=1 Tax=Geminicoccus sp. TaxID=2024832 RepID=UPI002BF84332|nr:MATE family efflux transporter [Geminicoccus sp.]HWL71161.1 MATE family efflux transporter [Geminicoccus sp.]